MQAKKEEQKENQNDEIIDTNIKTEEQSKPLLEEPKEEKPKLKEDKDRGFKKDAYHDSNIFSRLFFFWSFYILYLARKIQLVPSNLGTLSKSNDSSNFSKNIDYFWNEKGYKNK